MWRKERIAKALGLVRNQLGFKELAIAVRLSRFYTIRNVGTKTTEQPRSKDVQLHDTDSLDAAERKIHIQLHRRA